MLVCLDTQVRWNWVSHIRSLLCGAGFANVWLQQGGTVSKGKDLRRDYKIVACTTGLVIQLAILNADHLFMQSTNLSYNCVRMLSRCDTYILLRH